MGEIPLRASLRIFRRVTLDMQVACDDVFDGALRRIGMGAHKHDESGDEDVERLIEVVDPHFMMRGKVDR